MIATYRAYVDGFYLDGTFPTRSAAQEAALNALDTTSWGGVAGVELQAADRRLTTDRYNVRRSKKRGGLYVEHTDVANAGDWAKIY